LLFPKRQRRGGDNNTKFSQQATQLTAQPTHPPPT
jgi:hypothetical protein